MRYATRFDERRKDRWRLIFTTNAVHERGVGLTGGVYLLGWHWMLGEPIQIHETNFGLTLWLWWPLSLHLVTARYQPALDARWAGSGKA